MSQATRRKASSPAVSPVLARGIREGALIVCSLIALYLLIALGSYDRDDPGWSHVGFAGHVRNHGGAVGAWFADFFFYLFGYLAYLFPVMVAYAGWLLYQEGGDEPTTDMRHLAWRFFGFIFTIAAGTALAGLHLSVSPESMAAGAGGALGALLGGSLIKPFSHLGTTLLLLALFFTGVTLATGLSWFRVLDITGEYAFAAYDYLRYSISRLRETLAAKRAVAERQEQVATKKQSIPRTRPRIEPVITKVEPSARAVEERQGELFESADKKRLPALSLLDKPKKATRNLSAEELEALSRLVEIKLLDFGVQVEVVAVHPGPVITRFELQPAPGVKVSQIANLAKDLARALSVVSVRIVEVIPGKPYVGLEIPNEQREIVGLGEVLESKAFANFNSPITLALGKDIAGQPVAADLGRMPHLLVAGTTGSGKSVALNCMVLSLLYNATPEQVRLIMIDPKMLELSIYEGIPHLLAPVVTDMKHAANALRWCVGEMDRRYRLLAALGTRNLAGYNRMVKEATDSGKPIPDPLWDSVPGLPVPNLEPLPLIVVIIDELADMMMVVGKKVEELIARLAQKARASGIHLIIATQRPSVDVLTGLIKANIPTRIAFQVSSRIDSRTILDQMGAEQLLGHGDMLFLPPGTGMPTRVHGAFVDDHEVHKVVNELKKLGSPDYIDDILRGDPLAEAGLTNVDESGLPSGDGEADELYDVAVKIVTETRRASVSGVQRRLKIGYNRAARMVEQMERAGVVGPVQSNGSREVLAPPPPPVD